MQQGERQRGTERGDRDRQSENESYQGRKKGPSARRKNQKIKTTLWNIKNIIGLCKKEYYN